MEQIITKRDVVPVRNRNRGTTCYKLLNGIQREFAPGQTRDIDLEELRELAVAPGGEYALKHYFIINDQDALSALSIETEPEYFYTEAEVKKLLEEGTLDQLEDCLNFAPEGVLELVKKISVETELPDMRKRKLIDKIIGFNVDNAITVNEIMNENDDDSAEKTAKPVRKAEAIATVPTRKAEPVKTTKYTRITK